MTQYTPVGQSQVVVPSLGFGTAPLGDLYRPVSDREAIATVEYALGQGLNFFDTAPFYGKGLAESRLGQALKGVPRQSFVVATKVGRLITGQEPHRQAVFDFSREGILASIEASLKRLQLDFLDIVHLHDPDAHYRQALEEAFPVLLELKSQGVIGAIGAGMNQWQMLRDFAMAAPFDCFLLAGRYTLLEQPALPELLPLCQARGISVLAGGIYNSGILATGPQPGAKYNYHDAPAPILERVRRIEEVCARFQVPLRVVALHFPFAHPAIKAVLVGLQSVGEVKQTLEGLTTPVPPALWLELKERKLLAANVPAGADLPRSRQS